MNRTQIILGSCAFWGLLLGTLTQAANANPSCADESVRQLAGTNPPSVEQNYPFASGHWVSLVLDWGVKVKLEDGSVWEIAAKDQSKTRNWLVAQKISVTDNLSDRYPFKITNIDLKATADARLISRPR